MNNATSGRTRSALTVLALGICVFAYWFLSTAAFSASDARSGPQSDAGGFVSQGSERPASAATLTSQDEVDDPETAREKALAVAAEQDPEHLLFNSPALMRGEGGTLGPLFAGVDDVAIPAVRIDVVNNTSVPVFSGFQVWGAAFDAVNNKVYFNNGSTLYEWPVGGSVTTLGPIVDSGGAAQSMVGLAFYNGTLYGTKNIANEAIWQINTTTRVATVFIDYVDGDLDCGGVDADPATGTFYCTNDDATPHGAGLVRINSDGTVTPIAAYPAGQTDVDGLAIGNDGRAYMVTDDASGPIYVWDFVGNTYLTPLTAPWPTSETFAAGAWIAPAGASTPTPTPTPTPTITPTPSPSPSPSPTPPGQSLLLVPNTTTNTVVALDPQTGDLVNANFISIANLPTGAKTHAILHSDGQRILVSHQVADAVYAYALDGTFLGVFAPAGGPNTTIMDNVRGMAFHPSTGHFLVTSAAGTNINSVVEFDVNGNFLGTFIAPGAGGIVGPWSILFRGADVLVSASGNHIYSYQQNGTPNGRWNVEDINFPEQIVEAANSDILAAAFSSPAGVHEYTAAGSRLAIYNPVTGNRGVWELPNGNILTSNGTGIHEITRGNVLVRTIIAGSSYMFSLAQFGPGPTPSVTPTPAVTPTPTPTPVTPTPTPTPVTPTPTPTVTPTIIPSPSPSPTCLPGDGLLYALNDDSSGSFIYGFRVNETTGALTALSGFPVAAQNGGINSIVSERMVADRTNRRLYVINDSSDTVSAYSIDPVTGALTQMPFSPIALGTGVWNTIAVHSSGSPLVIANNATNGLVHSFAITATTATPAPGSPYTMGAGVAGFSSRFSVDGGYYYVGGNLGNFIGGFSVNAGTGALTTIAGAPFDSGAPNPLGYATDAAGRLFSVDSTNGLRAFASTNGALTPATGNPFPSGLTQRRFGLVHPNGNFYMVAGNTGNNVGVYQIAGSGTGTTLTAVAGSPFATGGTTANALAANQTGTFIYVANRISRNITTFGVNTGTGVLTSLGVQPSNTLGSIGAINGIAYVTGAGGTCPTPTPTVSPSPTASVSPTVSPTPTVAVTPTPTPPVTPSPTPGTSVQFAAAAFPGDESQVEPITITRTGNLSGITTVNFSAASGTATGGIACTSGIDFLTVTDQLVVFNPNEATKTVFLTICPDLLNEGLETANLTLSGVTGGTIGTPGTAVMNINDTANQFRNVTEMDFNLGAPAAPYPSTITVTGGPLQIGSIRVTLYDVVHQAPDNMDFLLVGPTGVKYVLMADAGGPAPLTTPATLTFSDTAATVVPNNGPLVTGKFRPANWETPVSSFPAPAPPPPYIEPGTTGVPTMQSAFGFTNANGTWSLWARDDNGLNAPEVLSGQVLGGWGIEFVQTTAAGLSLSGRVTTAAGAGIRNAAVVVTGNSLPEPLLRTTGSFGYFAFDGLRAGETYVVTVNSQRYTFTVPSQVVTLVDNLADVDFTADQ